MNAFTPLLHPVPLEVLPLPLGSAHNPRFGGAAIRFQGVSKRFASAGSNPAVTALDAVSLDIPAGAIAGIIGRSGAGKSTLLRTINGLDRPSAGAIFIDDLDVGGLPPQELRALRRDVGMIFQHFALLSSRTVFDNIALPLELAGTPRAEIVRRVDELIDLVGLADKRGRYPVELSGGQKQRVGIARALATRPRVLLSDEATSALDPETTRSILALLKEINALTGVTIVLITHEMHVIKAICDQVAVIEGGRIIEQGLVYDVFARPQHATTRSFVASVAGSEVPAAIAARLRDEATGARETVIRIVFTGEHATAPVIARLARKLDADINVLAGQVDAIGGRPFGNLVIAVPARPAIVEAVRADTAALGLFSEVLGHVA